MARQSIDSGATQLAVCDCGWRGNVTLSKSTAWAQAVEHARLAHDEPRRASAALAAWERRNG